MLRHDGLAPVFACPVALINFLLQLFLFNAQLKSPFCGCLGSPDTADQDPATISQRNICFGRTERKSVLMGLLAGPDLYCVVPSPAGGLGAGVPVPESWFWTAAGGWLVPSFEPVPD